MFRITKLDLHAGYLLYQAEIVKCMIGTTRKTLDIICTTRSDLVIFISSGMVPSVLDLALAVLAVKPLFLAAAVREYIQKPVAFMEEVPTTI